MAIMAMLDCIDAIGEECGPEISGADDLLGSGHPREMAAAGTAMTIIKNLFSFRMCKATTKNGIDSAPVKDISNEEVARGMVTDTTTFVSSDIGLKLLRAQV